MAAPSARAGDQVSVQGGDLVLGQRRRAPLPAVWVEQLYMTRAIAMVALQRLRGDGDDESGLMPFFFCSECPLRPASSAS
jgi:hypothetical protein